MDLRVSYDPLSGYRLISFWPQVALYDIAFNCGSFKKWPHLTTAVRAQDWKTAAKECIRPAVGTRRNQDTASQFLSTDEHLPRPCRCRSPLNSPDRRPIVGLLPPLPFSFKFFVLLVGAGRFERPTPCAQGRCATRLRYAPTSKAPLILNHF
jgi:hypothetical protein